MAKPWYLETSTRSEPSEQHLTTENTSGRKKRAAKDIVAETTSTPKTITTLLGDFDYEKERNRNPRGRSRKKELFVEKFILVETLGPNTEKERPSTSGPGNVITGTGTGENTMITSASRMTTSPGNFDYERKRNRQERPTTIRPGQLVPPTGSQAPPTGSQETPTGSEGKVIIQKVTKGPEGDETTTRGQEPPTGSKEIPTKSKDSPTGSKDKVIVQKVAKKPEGEEQESADEEELDAVVVDVTEEKNNTSSSSTTEAPPMIEDVQRILLPPDDEKIGMELTIKNIN